MENDIIFKSAIFGGFKKDAVMCCIDALTAEKVAAMREAEANRSALHAVNAKMRELEQHISNLTTENAALAGVRAQFETADAQNSEMSAQIGALTADNAEKTGRLAALEAERDALKADCQRLHAVETQLGAAMIDARRYSDQIVDEAKQKAKKVSGDAGMFLEEAADRISAMTSDINNISESFNRALAELLVRINTLTGTLGDESKKLLDGPAAASADAETTQSPAETAPQAQNDEVKADSVYLFGAK